MPPPALLLRCGRRREPRRLPMTRPPGSRAGWFSVDPSSFPPKETCLWLQDRESMAGVSACHKTGPYLDLLFIGQISRPDSGWPNAERSIAVQYGLRQAIRDHIVALLGAERAVTARRRYDVLMPVDCIGH